MPHGKGLSYSGPHIILDCYECNKEKLSDVALIFNTLESFPEKIGMTILKAPYVFKYNNEKPEDWGITGIVLIADSHITIHTFPEKNHAFIDIFSSKDFNTDFAISFMKDLFEAKTHDVQLSSRGSDFLKAPAMAA